MVHTHQGYEHHARERVRVSDDSLPRPGFKSAAVYFEGLAKKEPGDYDRKHRLLEVAGFYRSLAGIIPAMPTQYKVKVGPSVTRAERSHARAEECRTLADCFTDPTCREQLRQLAQNMIAWPWRQNKTASLGGIGRPGEFRSVAHCTPAWDCADRRAVATQRPRRAASQTGSMTPTNTIGTVRVASSNGAAVRCRQSNRSGRASRPSRSVDTAIAVSL